MLVNAEFIYKYFWEGRRFSDFDCVQSIEHVDRDYVRATLVKFVMQLSLNKELIYILEKYLVPRPEFLKILFQGRSLLLKCF